MLWRGCQGWGSSAQYTQNPANAFRLITHRSRVLRRARANRISIIPTIFIYILLAPTILTNFANIHLSCVQPQLITYICAHLHLYLCIWCARARCAQNMITIPQSASSPASTRGLVDGVKNREKLHHRGHHASVEYAHRISCVRGAITPQFIACIRERWVCVWERVRFVW